MTLADVLSWTDDFDLALRLTARPVVRGIGQAPELDRMVRVDPDGCVERRYLDGTTKIIFRKESARG